MRNAELILPSSDGETRMPLELTREEIEPLVRQVFKDEYLKNLFAWTAVLTKLEDAGFDQEEIAAMLYQESPSSWPRLARTLTGR